MRAAVAVAHIKEPAEPEEPAAAVQAQETIRPEHLEP
jgi:hypothetical protein